MEKTILVKKTSKVTAHGRAVVELVMHLLEDADKSLVLDYHYIENDPKEGETTFTVDYMSGR